MALPVLGNQRDQIIAVDQDAVLASGQGAGAQAEGLVGQHQCPVTALGTAGGQGLGDHAVRQRPGMAGHPTQPPFGAPDQQKIGPRRAGAGQRRDFIALGPQQVGRMAGNLGVGHGIEFV